jgi:hypothetical protein
MTKQYNHWNRYTHSTAAPNGLKSSYELPLDRWIAPKRIRMELMKATGPLQANHC